jgi:26S proteasome regulatory subunit N12
MINPQITMLGFPPVQSSPIHLVIVISTLELGVLLSVADHDMESFARNMSQLKPYYTMLMTNTTTSINVSLTHKCHIVGLNLLYLLVENRLSEFHSELELISSTEATSPYISFPIHLERQLMVGLYDEVFRLASSVPDPSYVLFMDPLLQTVRDSIADCLEVSYTTLSVSHVVQMMKFDHEEQLLEYIHLFRQDWILETNNTMICFQPPTTGRKVSDIPSMKFMEQTLTYATELERII